MGATVSTVVGVVGDGISALGGAIGGVVSAVGGAVGGVVSAVGGAIGGFFSSAGESIGGPLGGALGDIGGFISRTSETVGGFIGAASETIGGFVRTASKTVGDFISAVGKTVGGFINKVITAAVEVISTVVGAIVDTFESTFGWIFDVVGGLIEVFFSVPFVGAILRDIWHVVQTVVLVGLSIPDIILGIFGIFPEKRMRIVVMIQRDEENVPVADPADVLPSIQRAIDIFKAEANVRILPVGPFKFSSPFQDKPTADSAYIFVEEGQSDSDTLDIDCGTDDFINDLGSRGTTFNSKLLFNEFFTNGRRVIGYGSPVAAFAVRSFTDTKNGCSLGPLTDYVTVKFSATSTRTLAHELGHACDLWHDSDTDNLMNPGGMGSTLGPFQKINLRASRHVTYF